MEVSGQLHAPAALPPGKEPLVPIAQGAGWAPEPVWKRLSGEKFLAPTVTPSPDHPARSPALYHCAIAAPTVSLISILIASSIYIYVSQVVFSLQEFRLKFCMHMELL